MKIAIVSRGDRLTGGASRGADELAHWLIEAGHSVTHFCREFQQTPAAFQRRLYGGVDGRAAHYLNAVGKRLGFMNTISFEYYLKLRRLQDDFDLFHFHDLASALCYETMVRVSRRKPVIFTVHDCSAFTGGCIYPMGCKNFKTGCGTCPQIGRWPLNTRFDQTRFMQKQRRHAADASGIQYVFPSDWIRRELISTMPLARPGIQINNAIDLKQIVPTGKEEARRKLGLPQDRPIVLISMHNMLDERKGVKYAVEAIRQVTDLSPVLISTGHSNEVLAAQIGDVPLTSFGHVSRQDQMALIYSAADVYLFTSLADNCPYSLLETMGSGTAVVAFAVGGVPEIVISEENGLLVPALDHAALAVALRRALQDRSRTQKWGEQARRRIETHFNKDPFMKTIGDLYQQFTQDWRASP